jgi:hypothetical protein
VLSNGHVLSDAHVGGSHKVIGLFNLPNISSSIVALGLTQPYHKSAPEVFLGGKAQPVRKSDLTAISYTGLLVYYIENVGSSTSHNPMGPHVLLNGYL